MPGFVLWLDWQTRQDSFENLNKNSTLEWCRPTRGRTGWGGRPRVAGNVPGAKNLRIDILGKKDGMPQITEAKASSSARLRESQKQGFALIEKYGGTVVGKKGGSI